MSATQLGALIVRIFALFFFLGCVSRAVTIPALFMREPYITWLYGSHMVLYFGLATIFWLKATTIGKSLVGDQSGQILNLPSYEQCLHVVLISFGIWTITMSIPDISAMLAYIISDGMIEGRKIQGVNLWEYGIRIFLYIGIGLFLVLGSQGLKKLLLSVKNAGLDK